MSLKFNYVCACIFACHGKPNGGDLMFFQSFLVVRGILYNLLIFLMFCENLILGFKV
jgi:hypothetical protein